MPYAAKDMISQDPIEGGIEISDEQYLEGLNGIMEGKRVNIVGGFSVDFPNTETTDQILNAPNDLFGGPTLGEIFNGN